MVTVLDQRTVIDTLAGQWAAINSLLAELPEGDWRASTPCPGWDVHAAVAHMIGTERSLEGAEQPPELPASWPTGHLQNDIARANERWIAALAPLPGDQLATEFAQVTARRVDALRALDQAAWNAEGFTPAGADAYGRFMRIRVFDCWMHEQDIRDAIARPGHVSGPAVDLSLDEIATALGFVVGKKAKAAPGSSVRFALTGEPDHQIDVAVAERARVVEHLTEAPTVTLRMPLGTFTRLCGGRITAADVADDVEVEGDDQFGQRILDNLGYTI